MTEDALNPKVNSKYRYGVFMHKRFPDEIISLNQFQDMLKGVAKVITTDVGLAGDKKEALIRPTKFFKGTENEFYNAVRKKLSSHFAPIVLVRTKSK